VSAAFARGTLRARLCTLVGIFLAGSMLVGCATRSAPASRATAGQPPPLDDAHRRLGAPPRGHVWAGAGKVDVSPAGSMYLAGFSPGRRSTGVHDPLYARCVFLDDGTTPLVLVELDLVGFLHPDVVAMRSRITAKHASSVIVASTHVHAAPDTIGLWGPGLVLPVGSGKDPAYMERVEAAGAECVAQAATQARPATAVFARSQVPPDLSYNIHAEDRPTLAVAKDDALTAVRWIGDDGTGIATIVSWACHPEALGRDNTLATADYPGVLASKLEEKLGGTAMLVNGAVGGLVTVRDPETGPHGFELAEQVGSRVADVAVHALQATSAVPWPAGDESTSASTDATARDEFRAVAEPLHAAFDNRWWRFFRWLGLLDVELENDHVATEVMAWRVGPSVWLTVPGEIFPSLGRRYREAMKSDLGFLVGLGNDELGYIMEPTEFEDDIYSYEQMMSLGPKTGPALDAAVDAALQALDAPHSATVSPGGE